MFDENFFLFVVNLFIMALCCGLFILMPRLTRKSYLFGVNIPPQQSGSPEALALKRRYVHTCLLGFSIVMLICVIQFILWRDMTLLVTIYLPLLVILLGFVAFVPNWKKTLRLKEERGWQITGDPLSEKGASQTRGSLSSVPWMWYVLSFALVAAGFALAIMRYPLLPELIPGHLDADMMPTRWVKKTWWNVLMMPLINAATLALMIFVAILIEKARLQVDPSKPRLSFAQHRVYRKRLGHTMGFFTLVLILFMAVMGLPVIFPDSSVWSASVFWGSLIFIHIPIALLIAVLVKTGQGGCKVKINVEEDGEDSANNQASVSSGESGSASKSGCASKNGGNKTGDDKYWILGMFYYNPEDNAYFVENRFGTNIGFNYARLPGKIGMTVLLLGIIALYVWMTMLFV